MTEIGIPSTLRMQNGRNEDNVAAEYGLSSTVVNTKTQQ